MRNAIVLLLAALSLQSGAAAAVAPVTQATESLVDAVAAPQLWADEPVLRPPPVTDEAKSGVAQELWNNPAILDSYSHLAATEKPYTSLRALEELEESGAAWCLATGLCHPSGDIRVRCATALQRLAKPGPAHFVLEVADAFAVSASAGEQAKSLARLQHALCGALNATTGLAVELKDGQDPDGLRAAFPRWKQALRERAGPIIRSPRDRQIMAQVRENIDAFVLTISLAPKPQGLWDPSFDVASVTLSTAPVADSASPTPPAARPIHARARLTHDQVETLLTTMADKGFFTQATSNSPERADRHCRVVISTTGRDEGRYYVIYDWKPPMLDSLESLRRALDGEPAQWMRRMLAPLAAQNAEWAKQANAMQP